jgi:hypothetical protein
MTALCRSCSWTGPVPVVAKCPECGSRYLARAETLHGIAERALLYLRWFDDFSPPHEARRILIADLERALDLHAAHSVRGGQGEWPAGLTFKQPPPPSPEMERARETMNAIVSWLIETGQELRRDEAGRVFAVPRGQGEYGS